MRNLKIAGLVTALLLAALLVVQNTDVVSVRFLVWELKMSRIILLSGAILVGFVAGFIAAKLGARRGL